MAKQLTNEEFLQKLEDKNIKYIPLEDYKKSNAKIKWRCYKDERHIWESKPNHIMEGHGCPICTNQKIVVGINDMWTINPKLASMLLDKNDGYKYSENSHRRVDWVCQRCKSIIKDKEIKNVNKNGLSCHICSDGTSYSEKFVMNMLNQLEVEYIHDKPLKWSNGKRYDFYIKELSLIIETHGRQHYCDDFNFRKYSNRVRSLYEEKNNDILKRELALNNSIKNYIEIDCSESDLKYVKQSILESKLSDIFNLSNIDWEECNKSTMSSTTIEVCNLWNNGLRIIKRISEIVGIDRITVINKLKLCSKYNLCDYKPYSAEGQKLGKRHRKKVICVETNVIYDSISSVANDGYNPKEVSLCCNNKIHTHKSLHWQFVN